MPLDPTTGMETIPQDPTTVITPDQYAAFLAKAHKGLRGQPVAVNPTIADPTNPLQKIPNPNPAMRYSFADGKYIDLVKQDDGSYGIARGTAAETGPSTNPRAPKVVKMPDGSLAEEQPDGTLTPAAPAKATAPKIVIVNGQAYAEQPDGKLVPQTDPKTVDKPFTIPDDANPGQTKAVTWQDYNAYMTAKNKADATAVAQQRVDNTNTNTQQGLQNALSAANDRSTLLEERNRLQALYDQGKITEAQATEAFKEKYDMLTYQQTQTQNAFNNENTMLQSGIAAGNQAMEAARLGTVNAVGPDFGAHYAASLSAASKGDVNGVHFGAGDFTTPMPNYQQLATQGAAAAIAHLSPYAASLVGQPGMQQYQGAGAAAPVQPATTASQYVPPNNEATASQTQRTMTMPIPPYQPVNRAVGANAQIQAGLR